MKKYEIWWADLSLQDKFYQVIPWLKSKGKNVAEIHPNNVSDSDIKEMYNLFINKKTKHNEIT